MLRNYIITALRNLNRNRTNTAISVIGLSLGITCSMVLFLLMSYLVNQKIKEIGVRKVLGASVNQILILFGKTFFKLVVISFLIAAPLSYFGMNLWLENYENHINIGPGVFAVAIASTLLIALLTVGVKSFRAATVNPVDSLQDE